MKKSRFLNVLFVLFLLITFDTSSYGAGKFTNHYNKGVEYYKQGKYDRAGKEFKAAIKLKPNDVYALYGLGNTYYCMAKYDEAVKIYKKAININPDYAKVHYSLSLAYSKLGMTHEAEEQKRIFRKLSKGEKISGISRSHAASAHTSKHGNSIDYSQKKSLHDSKRADDTHETTTSVYAPNKHDNGHKTESHQAKSVYESHKTPVRREKKTKDSSRSIFKGYSGETHKADKRIFAKEHYEVFTTIKNPFSSIKYFILDQWHTSIISKVWICTAGYIFATQIWLCIVTFSCVIVWRIREKGLYEKR